VSHHELLDVALATARASGEVLLARFGTDLRVETKTSPTDLVSEADRAAEEAALAVLSNRRPEDGIVSEEGGRYRSSSGLTWIVDPLDGTINYLFGLPIWSVSVAAADEQGAVVGVVHDPVHSETFTAVRGDGARLNDRPISVSDRAELAMALIGTGFAYAAEAREIQGARIPRVVPKVRDLRRGGSAALDLAWVACGRLDGFFEAPMNPWDKAAGILLITEAGGVVSELRAPIDDNHGVIAGGPKLHDALRALILP
jgi:myo-inositol-1(or 4)-monophosphatase